MGGWMTYQRALRRGRVSRDTWCPAGSDPYPRGDDAAQVDSQRQSWATLVGDLRRMERDYLEPVYPAPPFATRPGGSSPAERAATDLGLDVEVVRAVLRYVFTEQP